MKQPKKRAKKIESPRIEDVESAMNVAMATEMTGLYPSIPGDATKARALDDIGGTHAPKAER